MDQNAIQAASAVQDLGLREWYLAAAPLLAGAVQAFRKFPGSRKVWERIPDGWRGYLVLALGALTAVAGAVTAGTTEPKDLLAAALGGAFGIGAGAMGVNAALTESHVPWNGKAGGVVKLPVALLALALLGSGQFACSSAQASEVANAVERGRQDAKLTYHLANTSVKFVSNLHHDWIESRAEPTPAELKVNDALVAALVASSDALQVYKSWLEAGDGEVEAKKRLRGALEQLMAAVRIAAMAGVEIPPPLVDGLEIALNALQGFPVADGGAS